MQDKPTALDEQESRGLDLMIEALLESSGYNFRHYARASIWRRLRGLMADTRIYSVEHLAHRVRHERHFRARVLRRLSIPVSELFRNPAYFSYLRREVLPTFRGRDSIRIWHAGCATGEEVFSMAILLREAGLYERSTLYATDFNSDALRKAQAGVFSLASIRTGTANYLAAGGTRGFCEYYRAHKGVAKLDSELLSNVQFSSHNLVSDSGFCEVDLVLCRNVLIYFDLTLQERCVRLFEQALGSNGVLCLGERESLELLPSRTRFCALSDDMQIYRQSPRPTRVP